MAKFPVDAPVHKVIKALEALGFQLVRKGTHISMVKRNLSENSIPLTMPNHRHIKRSTLRAILTQAGISRNDFLKVYKG